MKKTKQQKKTTNFLFHSETSSKIMSVFFGFRDDENLDENYEEKEVKHVRMKVNIWLDGNRN